MSCLKNLKVVFGDLFIQGCRVQSRYTRRQFVEARNPSFYSHVLREIQLWFLLLVLYSVSFSFRCMQYVDSEEIIIQ